MPIIIQDLGITIEEPRADRPANMWAADLEGYTPTADDRRAWRQEALEPQLLDLLPLGGGLISPYDGMY